MSASSLPFALEVPLAVSYSGRSHFIAGNSLPWGQVVADETRRLWDQSIE
jgi:hypothetical protein